MTLRVGLSLQLTSQADKESLDIAEVVSAAVEAEGLGFDSVWIAEHHFTAGFCPSPLLLAAAVASRTERIRIGTGVLIAPLYHPLRLAENVCLLDAVSGGRLILGLGQGYVHQEFAAYGLARQERTARFLETVGVLRGVLEQGSPARIAPNGEKRAPQIWPEPVQHPVPIWIGAYSAAAIRRAARWGYPFFLGGTNLPRELIVAKYRTYLTAFAERNPGKAPVVPLLQALIVSKDPERVWSRFGNSMTAVMRDNLRRYGSVVAADATGSYRTVTEEDDPVFADRQELRRRLLILGPEEAVSFLSELRGQIPFNYLIIAPPPGLPRMVAQESLELFASRVRPRLMDDEIP